MSATCSEYGLVKSLAPGGRALVSIHRAEACHSCSSKAACMALGGQSKEHLLVMDNRIGAEPGDRVAISMPENRVIQASAVIYLFPAGFLLGGALLGSHLASTWGTDPNLTSLGASVVGLLLGLGAVRVVGTRLWARESYQPRLERVVSRAGENAPWQNSP